MFLPAQGSTSAVHWGGAWSEPWGRLPVSPWLGLHLYCVCIFFICFCLSMRFWLCKSPSFQWNQQFAAALIEIALTTPGGDKWPRIVPCRLEVCGDLVCTRCCCTWSGNNEKRFRTISCLIEMVYQKGMQSGSFPLWWLLNSLLVPRFRTPQPRPAISLFLDFSLFFQRSAEQSVHQARLKDVLSFNLFSN